ncbi:hypothetical protein MLD38_007076 [Melastoma candidum]|uniref:Uncharacterized protein n=1 Tax=Melastoma candidum TaxID=119954 RepID=A0ACB9RQ30_9MYRT|nr:hypothetical protein MLD38_007076 [Melastoma candidum]
MVVEEEQDEDRAQCRTSAVVVTRPATIDSSPVQESPFSNYLNTLSPIKSAKAANVGQTFHGINSSPIVFASPTISSQRNNIHLKRIRMFESPNDVRKDDPTDSCQRSKELVDLCGNASDDVNKEISDSKDMLRVQSCSSSSIVDAFLADPFEADCTKFTHSSGRQVNCSKSTLDFDHEGDSTKGSEREGTDLQHVSPRRSSPDADELFSSDGPAVGAEEYHGIGPSFSVRCDVPVGDLPIDDGGDQSGIDPVLDIKGGSHVGPSPSHVLPPRDPFQDSEVNENPGEDASGSLRLLDDTQHREVLYQQRFLLRRCLRFDDMFLDDSSNSLGPMSNDVNSLGSLAVEDLGNLDLSEETSTFIKPSVSTVISVITGPEGKRSAITTSKPSGIGLHLNSIVGARSFDSRETICMKHESDNHGGRDSIPVGAGTGILLDKNATFPHDVVDPHNFTNAQEHYGTPHDKRMIPLGFSETEFAQTTAKRRRKASNASDTDGCKRCSCKKSRCLKLYCDCFAAGLFCTEPCACQGCLNRFEEQDTVLAARELIESRNPLAFAPKIVLSNKELDRTIGEDGIMSTPSSSRHKKGCNCKRSMCQKKYCECYQANVGCSDNCRCEGCKNVFGTKEASLEGTGNVKLAMGGTYSRDHLMPPTPSFQFSDSRKGLQRSRLAIECPSPNSSVKLGAAGWSREMQSEVSKESSTLETIADFIDSDFSEKADEFAPKHDSLGGSSNLAPLSSPTTMKSSSESSKTEPTPFTICYGGGHPPSRFLWRGGSLETPGIVSGGEKSHLDDNPGGKVYGNLEDDAPGVPKDVPSPTKPVIVGSPNRKRVSSPHKQVQECRINPSTALRSGGKFILKAVPSFPPLTPLLEPRSNTSEPHGPP